MTTKNTLENTQELRNRKPSAISTDLQQDSEDEIIDTKLVLTCASSPSTDSELGFKISFFIITLLTLATRIWNIQDPAQVVFDEVHFGKFASYYLRREYFFDVHPPMAKMAIALAGYFLGYDGHFLFDNIGDGYIENNVPHLGLRIFCAMFGILVIPVCFLIMKEIGLSLPATIFGAMILVLDNALIAQSRLILLDSQLMFYCILTLYCWIKFYKQRFKSFQINWWKWLILTGLSLAFTMGVKMVGLFTVATIGVATLFDLWERLDIKRGLTVRQFMRHFAARALCLIFLPIFVYLAFFAIHFAILTKTGPGDDFMSNAFQEGLIGNKILTQTTNVPYLSNITLLHKNKARLHSHKYNYPLRYKDQRVSSQGQQVTGYPFDDDNNKWVIEEVDPELYSGAAKYTPDEIELIRKVRYVKHNDIIRLRHYITDSYLITHDVASPLTATNMEITTLPSNTADTRYAETLWNIVISDEDDSNEKITIESRRYNVRLVNVVHNVAVHCTNQVLPEWGFKQQEVNGNKKISDPNNNWIIDLVEHARIVNGKDIESVTMPPKPGRKLTFGQKFNELQSLMLIHNSRLTGSHPYSSNPISWPFVIRGISYWEKNEGLRQIYVLGNPFIWWSVVFTILLFIAFYIMDLLIQRRGVEEFSPETRKWWLRSSGFLLMAWAFHYIPFFMMGRQLFLHHYFPAFIMSTMVTACFVDFLFRVSFIDPKKFAGGNWNSKRFGGSAIWTFVIVMLILATISFLFFYPLSYGTGFNDLKTLEARKWFKSWDIQHAKNKQ